MIDYMDLEKFVVWLKSRGFEVHRVGNPDYAVTSSDLRSLAIAFNNRPAQGYKDAS